MTDPILWNETLEVRAHETDLLERWKPSAFFQTMQEAATHHAAALGFGYRAMLRVDKIWVLSRMKVRFTRFPRLSEAVVVTTFPRGVRQKLFFVRDFRFEDAQGETLALATSYWALISPSARRILPQAALETPVPHFTDRAFLDEPLEKIIPPAGLTERLQAAATYSAVDLMGHVNNARYVEWLCDAFGAEVWRERTPDWLQINYSNEVKPGEMVSVRADEAAETPGLWRFAGENLSSGQRAFEAALKWKVQ
jgi:acyl-ACP thioesterase